MTAKTTFKPEYTETASKLAALGATDREVAEALGVSERTIYRWKHEQPDFAGELRLGKEAADARVVQSLYHRAIGYTYDAVKVFAHNGKPVIAEYVEHVPPDTTAMIYWLRNRQPDEWRDKQIIDLNNTRPTLSEGEIAVRAASLFSKYAHLIPDNMNEDNPHD